MIRLLPNLRLELHFTSSPAHPVLMVNGKRTWLAVLNGGSNPRLGLSSELQSPKKGAYKGQQAGQTTASSFGDASSENFNGFNPSPPRMCRIHFTVALGKYKADGASKQEPQLERSEKSLQIICSNNKSDVK